MSKIVINNDCLTIINSSKRFSKIFCNYCESKLKIYTNDQIKHHLDTIKHKNNSEIFKKKEEKQVFIEIECKIYIKKI